MVEGGREPFKRRSHNIIAYILPFLIKKKKYLIKLEYKIICKYISIQIQYFEG